MAERKYNIGDEFGHWTLLRRLPPNRTTRMWECICDCGNVRVVVATSVTRGRSTQCRGCAVKYGRKGR
jgi:hypothetical protein